jgi:hypothetical protein
MLKDEIKRPSKPQALKLVPAFNRAQKRQKLINSSIDSFREMTKKEEPIDLEKAELDSMIDLVSGL